MNQEKNRPAGLPELMKLYSDEEMVAMINSAKQDVGADQPSEPITYEELLAEMEARGIDCTHVRNYYRSLLEILVELKEIKGRKRLFANWMMMNDDDFSAGIADDEDHFVRIRDNGEDGESMRFIRNEDGDVVQMKYYDNYITDKITMD